MKKHIEPGRKQSAGGQVQARRVGAYEAKTHLSRLLDEVEREGVVITITRNDRAVARLEPIGRDRNKDVVGTMARMEEMRRGVRLGGIPIRTLITEGRRR